MQNFEIVVEKIDGRRCLLGVRGELDMASVEGFERALAAELRDGRFPAVVDLSDCEFIDSSGIAAIVTAQRAGDGNGHGPAHLALVVPGGQVEKLLTLTGVTRRVEVFSSRDEAISAIVNGRGEAHP